MTIHFKSRAVIYDMDGILVDSEPIWRQAEKDIFAEYNIDIVQLQKKYNLVTTGIRIEDIMSLINRLEPAYCIPVQQAASKILNLVIDGVIKTKPILPGVTESLSLCQSLGLKIGLASASSFRLIDVVTETLGITHFFHERLSAEHLTYSKPHPEVYLCMAEKLATHPMECVALEDSVAGMIATKAAQMRSIVIPEPANKDNPKYCIADVKLMSLTQLNAQHLG